MMVNMFGLNEKELQALRKLTTPAKVQDFLETIPANFERGGETCMSPRRVLRERKAHCMEGALLAATAFWIQGRPPLILDLKTGNGDDDHVLALFKHGGRWGAVTKTNHAVLRYRDPVYLNIRELAMSYFHEYFLDNGRKTLRSYSDPFDLSKLSDRSWVTSEKDLFYIPRLLDRSKHHNLLTKEQIRTLRPADPIEREVGKVTRWK